ncbi:ParA family protein (plasmid) [Tundrisphaera lichenicola]|uniref:ParA family protein n=1 Tax=Tundrisphaera lichenicola TaxID=2029860 RepID=UPI003EC0DF3A
MSVIAAVNLKGGVGKTSTVLHLSGALAQMGRRVLTVDADPQSSLTAGFLGIDEARALDPAATIAAVLAGDDPYPEAVIRPTQFDGISLLAGSRHAVGFNVPNPHLAPYEDQVRLREFLGYVRANFDVVIIDCPPNLHACSWAAMAAADALLVPVQPENFGSQGTVDVLESAAAVRATINPDLGPAWFVVSMLAARRAIHQAFVEGLRAGHGNAVFRSAIPEAVDFVEAVVALKPLCYHKPKGASAKAVRAVAEELLGRLASADSIGEAA